MRRNFEDVRKPQDFQLFRIKQMEKNLRLDLSDLEFLAVGAVLLARKSDLSHVAIALSPRSDLSAGPNPKQGLSSLVAILTMREMLDLLRENPLYNAMETSLKACSYENTNGRTQRKKLQTGHGTRFVWC